MLTAIITFILSNFSLVILILAMVISLTNIICFRQPPSETIFRWVALLSLGVTGIYTFITHAFFPALSSAIIGWAQSPFEYEVAVANLMTGLLGVFAFKSSIGFRSATALAGIIWLWGDAIGHIYQMIVHHNFSPGNAGSWFWTDVIIPFILLITICKMRSQKIAHFIS